VFDNQYYDLNHGGTANTQFTKFGEGVSDEENVTTINTWIQESVTWHDAMLIYQNQAVLYYLGVQTDRADVPPYDSSTVYNRIFEGTETIVPVVTGTAHQFLAVPGTEDERALLRSQKVQKVLSYKYDELGIQADLEQVTRDMILKRFGVLKAYWDIYKNDIDVKVIDPRLILIPKLRMDANDPWFPYVLEVQEYTRDEMRDFFPDADLEKLVFGAQMDVMSTTTLMNQWQAPIYQVIEATTNEWKVWKQGDKILKKMRNPFWDWDGSKKETKKTEQNGKVTTEEYTVYRNHLPYPTKEYVFFNPFTTGDAPVAEASMADIVIPIQDDINIQKRQIINNLVKMGNGQVYLDSEALPKELADQITSEPGLVIEGKNLASENRIRREPGVPLPQAHFENLQASIASFDNVFGIHAALRGNDNSETLGGQILNRNQNLSRIETLTRCLNRGVSQLANFLVQMMKMYYTEDHLIKILGRDGSIEFMHFTQNDIDDGVVIYVKSGTPPTLDPTQRYNQAIQLWQLNALDPETLFERLEFADPQLTAKKLAAWKQGQLLQESAVRKDEMIAGAMAKASAPAGGGEGEVDRNVETSQNVIQRATQDLGMGGAAPLSNPSN